MPEQKITGIYQDLLVSIGEDITREGLLKTPERAAKAMQFLTQGYAMDIDKVVGDALFNSNISEMILVKDIELFSLCEHHLLPFIGSCHAAYIPNGKIIGLSKIPRIVNMFARRLQVQENLTMQIANCIMQVTGALGVGVIIEAKHLCMMARGVEKNNSVTKTSAMLGIFNSCARTRGEFLSLVK